jgi:acyl-coenzyme A synthetase/AMP-(fatty) acid ligase
VYGAARSGNPKSGGHIGGEVDLYVLQQIHAAATATPDKLAVVANGRPISYSQFWRLIEGCRRSLEPFAPQSGVAAIAVGSNIEAWIIDLALRSLGLDTVVFYTDEGAAAVAELNAACVITLDSDPRANIAALTGANHLSLSEPSRQVIDDALPLPPLPEAVPVGGHWLLTSGTTGQPRTVLSRLGATEASLAPLRQLSRELAESSDPAPGEGVMNLLDFALWTAAGYTRSILAWCEGDAVVTHYTGGLHRSFNWPGITHTVATPYQLTVLMALPEGSFPYCPEMRLVISAGSVSPALARAARRRLTPRLVINLGSTESGLWARTTFETDEDLRWYRVLPTRKVEVVDEADHPLPPGQLGRVRVGMRDASSTGHLGDAAGSASAFADGWFYPGDLGVMDGEGRLALHGRTSDVININGDKFPAEPWEREIQEQLACDGVCVLAGRFQSEVEQIHVFIEARQPIGLDVLTEVLRSTLFGFPDAHVHKVDALPRTPLGKIRRFELARRLHDGLFQATSETPT